MTGRISLLVDSPLSTLLQAMQGLDGEVRRQIGRQTKAHAQPIWAEETRGQIQTRLQAKLASSARAGVTTRNVFLRAGTTGKIGQVPLSTLAKAIEFGADPKKIIKSTSKRGNPYERRMGSGFSRPRRAGYVAYPAASEAVPRIASLWVQTAIRTINESIEEVS